MRLRALGSGFRVCGLGLALGFRVEGFGVWGSEAEATKQERFKAAEDEAGKIQTSLFILKAPRFRSAST